MPFVPSSVLPLLEIEHVLKDLPTTLLLTGGSE